MLVIFPLLSALTPSPCMSKPLLDNRWYQLWPPVTPPADKKQIQMDLEDLKEKVSHVCVFIQWGGFMLWLTTVLCVVSAFDWSTFWAALTHINLLQVFILNRQMARGNYIYAKCSATWLSPLSSLITTKWVIVFFPACVRVRVCSLVYKVTVSRWLLGASWHSAACQDAVAEVMSVSAGAPGACN